MTPLPFQDRVILITGATGALGRAYASCFRGGKVCINDLNVQKDGTKQAGQVGQATPAAIDLCQELEQLGIQTMADGHDITTHAEQIIENIVKKWGRIDVVINNAGILRDSSFEKMQDKDWDLVHAVHVRAAFQISKAAWKYFQKQEYGKIINTASAAGLYGNFGQANYGSAKMALHGLTQCLAKEGEKKNIRVNTIAPLAASRMTESVMPEEFLKALKPESIAPIVAYLTHHSCNETGSLFEAGAGFVGKLRWERSPGAVFKADNTFTAGAVGAAWSKINNFKTPHYPSTIMEVDWMGLLQQAKEMSQNPKGQELRFDNKVVIITGSGAGIGRAYARFFANLGASIVINDFSKASADAVVSELTGIGAQAVANYNSVEDGDQIIETAMKAFGKVDILVNNAGVLRDKSFARMSDADWDTVYGIHSRGTFKCSRAVWPIFKKQKSGRIINTCSAVGLYGNFGQANYSSAKSGILGLSHTLSVEGLKHNIKVHTIAPNAGTAMTATVLPPDVVEALKPDYVAPLVAYLSHPDCDETDGVFEVGSGWIARVRLQRSHGVVFPSSEPFDSEDVSLNWKSITEFNAQSANYPSTAAESFSLFYERVLAGGDKVKKSKEASIGPVVYDYNNKDVALYNLSIGADRNELRWVYEGHTEFEALPTFGIVPAFGIAMATDFDKVLQDFSWGNLLHGEQALHIIGKIPTEGSLISTGRIVRVKNKGNNATVTVRSETKDRDGSLIFVNEFTNFIRGAHGAEIQGAEEKIIKVPERAPDKIVEEKTTLQQAAWYRLNGDPNPLHIDPEMSNMAGFDKPILHGLCTFGIAAKHIVKAYGSSKGTSLKSVKVRSNKHVFPGDTLQTEMWRDGDSVIFQVRVLERDSIVITHAIAELLPKAKF